MLTLSKPNFIQESVPLKPHNSFRFQATAGYFAIIDRLESLELALKWANSNNISITMLGEGSNLLLTGDIDGLVLINRLQGIEIEEVGDQVQLKVSAGENWHQLVSFTVEKGLAGIENLALIPGSVGASPVQNIGAYGVEVKDVLVSVQVMDRQDASLSWIEAKDCGFAYRDSHFKGAWSERYFITAVCLALSRQHELKLSYGGLAKGLPNDPSLQQVFDEVCAVRAAKLPDPKEIGNAGSFFKNPIVSNNLYQKILDEHPDLVAFSIDDSNWKLAAAWLIDKAGWKGFSRDGVGVYEKQALCLVNHGADQAECLLRLERDLKFDIKLKFGVILEREPVQLGCLPNF